jgi:hypothetical protein
MREKYPEHATAFVQIQRTSLKYSGTIADEGGIDIKIIFFLGLSGQFWDRVNLGATADVLKYKTTRRGNKPLLEFEI